jgi:RHS repeat-associated protein
MRDTAVSDNLGSNDVTADANNRVQEFTDYTPFGNINNHDQLAGYSEERKFTGQEYDSNTNLNYMNARYEWPNLSRFLSESPNSYIGMEKSSAERVRGGSSALPPS